MILEAINWIDIVVVIFVIIYGINRARMGFIHGLADVFTFLSSLVLAFNFFKIAGSIIFRFFGLSRGISDAVGFFAVATISEFILFIITLFLLRLIPLKLIRSKINKILGIFPALVSASMLLLFLFTTALSLPIRPDIKKAIATSTTGSFLSLHTFGLDKAINKVFGQALEETLTFLTVKPQGNEIVNLEFTIKDTHADSDSELKMLELVNLERQKANQESLESSESLREVARNHCRDMFARGYFSHYTPDTLSPFDRIDQANISYQAAGENLAYAPTVEIAHTGLMNSEGHKKNILSPEFGKVGIGVIDAGIYGKMFCQEFSN